MIFIKHHRGDSGVFLIKHVSYDSLQSERPKQIQNSGDDALVIPAVNLSLVSNSAFSQLHFLNLVL